MHLLVLWSFRNYRLSQYIFIRPQSALIFWWPIFTRTLIPCQHMSSLFLYTYVILIFTQPPNALIFCWPFKSPIFTQPLVSYYHLFTSIFTQSLKFLFFKATFCQHQPHINPFPKQNGLRTYWDTCIANVLIV